MAKRGGAARGKPKTQKRRPTRKRQPPRKRASSSPSRAQVAGLRHELTDAIERQSATAEILRVISNSPTDTQPVFDAIVQSGLKLFPDATIGIALPDGEQVRAVAVAAPDPVPERAWRSRFPFPHSREYMHSVAILDAKTIDIPDVLDAPADMRTGAKNFILSGHRAITIVPMMRGRKAIGTLSVVRLAPGPLSDSQLATLHTFADQAVIAIENTRTLNELRQRTDDLAEALKQQTATADVLKLISRSAFDLPTVLTTLLESAVRLCEADFGSVAQPSHGDSFVIESTYGSNAEYTELMRQATFRAGRGSAIGRALLEGETIHIRDAVSDPEYELTEAARVGNFRTLLGVPLMREGKALGVFAVGRTAIRPFTQKQIELISTFADQAAIAIENVRLFNETQEALDQQTAISDILRAISDSPGDVMPVFKIVTERAARICEATIVDIFTADNGTVKIAATFGDFGRPAIQESIPINRDTVMGRCICDIAPVHVEDLLEGDHDLPAGRELARRFGHRTILAVPLVRDGKALGGVLVRRTEARPFEDKHIALLTTFADQAAIAIENARLLNELRGRTDELNEALQQQTATAEVMQVISRSAFDLDTILQTLVDTAAHLCNAGPAQIFRRDNDVYRYAASRTLEPAYREIEKKAEIHPGRGTLIGRMALEKRAIHIVDAWDDPEYAEKDAARVGNIRTMLAVPLLRDAEPIGAFALARNHVEAFTEQQIKLVTTFADQAAIAIENVRLFEEVKARTEDLRESLQQQTATADVLKVISRAAFDLQLVLDTLVESAARLCGADLGWLFQRDGDHFNFAASFGHVAEVHDRIREYFLARNVPVDRGSVTGRSALEARIIHVPDVLADPEYTWNRAQEIGGYRAALGVPLLREGAVIGVIFLAKNAAEPYGAKQIELATTFADQAVIALENARLFREVQERTEELNESLQQQTATADVLKVISRSAFDLKTVMQTLLESAVRLAEADKGTITRKIDGEFFRTETTGFSQEFLDRTQAMPVKPERGSAAGRALLEGVPVHILDQQADPDYTFAEARKYDSFRTMLSIPLLREGMPLGGLTIARSVVRPFTDKQIELVTTFADQAAIAIENARLFEEVQSRTRELSRSLEDLQLAQDRLVQTEKLASLGQLTAGIAHEIKNPLNFVNNFSALSTELIEELNDVLTSAALDARTREEITELTHMLKGNLEKVVQHGRRADSIVKNMLLHSRQGSGAHQPAEINAIVEESLNLAYHGARAEGTGINITLQRDLDPLAGVIEVYPQEITRVLLNLISNGFYAAIKRKESNGGGFEPVLSAATKGMGDNVEIRIRDNGTGISKDVKDKIFNPFFTTKPAGEGTGLGLSMSHDIIVKQHGGRIDVESSPGEFTEFIITLPRKAAFQTGGTR